MTDPKLSELEQAAILLCNAHGWSYGGPETLEALAKRVAARQKALRRIATRDVDGKSPLARAWDYEQIAAEALEN